MNTKLKPGWRQVNLGEVADVTTGKKNVNQTNPLGQYIFFSCSDKIFYSDEYIYDNEALIIVGNGAYTGTVRYFSGKFDLYQRAYAVILKNKWRDIASIKYIYYYLKNGFEKKSMKGIRGTSIPYIVMGDITDYKIPLPPLPEQEEIAKILGTWDTAIEKTEALIAAKERQFKALLNILISQNTNKPDWREVKLRDVCDLYQPKTITQKDLIEDGEFVVFGANGIIGRYDQCNHKNPEVTVTCRGATCGTVNMSQPFSWITGNAMVCSPIEHRNLSKEYLYYCLANSDLNSVITGSAQPQITRSSIEKYSIPLPPPLRTKDYCQDFHYGSTRN